MVENLAQLEIAISWVLKSVVILLSIMVWLSVGYLVNRGVNVLDGVANNQSFGRFIMITSLFLTFRFIGFPGLINISSTRYMSLVNTFLHNIEGSVLYLPVNLSVLMIYAGAVIGVCIYVTMAILKFRKWFVESMKRGGTCKVRRS